MLAEQLPRHNTAWPGSQNSPDRRSPQKRCPDTQEMSVPRLFFIALFAFVWLKTFWNIGRAEDCRQCLAELLLGLRMFLIACQVGPLMRIRVVVVQFLFAIGAKRVSITA